MNENGTIAAAFLRVAKRICARSKKEGGRPVMERLVVRGGKAYASDGAVVIRVADTGSTATGYLDPKPLAAAKPVEFFEKSGGMNVKQGETFTHHKRPEGDDFPDIEKIFPQFDGPRAHCHEPFFVDPVILIDALDIFDKKGDRPRVQIYLPEENDGKTPLVIVGTVDGKDARAILLPLKVQK